MTAVALFLVALLAITVVVSGQLLRSQQRAHARREDLLLNQLLHAVGKPWQPAPADPPADRGFTEPTWTPSPEQDPL